MCIQDHFTNSNKKFQQLHQMSKQTSPGHNLVNIMSIQLLLFAIESYWQTVLPKFISCCESWRIVKIVKFDQKAFFINLNKLANTHILNVIFTVIIVMNNVISSKKQEIDLIEYL